MTFPYVVFTDGAAKGRNGEGPSSSGFVVYHNGEREVAYAVGIGVHTNNIAEYTALLMALNWVLENVAPGDRYVHFKSDSELMVRHILGVYVCASASLRMSYDLTMARFSRLDGYKIEWIPRAQNAEADEICNRTLKLGIPVEEYFEIARTKSEDAGELSKAV